MRMCLQRRRFVKAIAGSVATWPLRAYGQEGRTYHIGVLQSNPRGSPLVTALFDELRRNGFIEGRNLFVDGRGIGVPWARFGDVAREIAKTNIEALVVGGGAPPIRSVQAVAPAIPARFSRVAEKVVYVTADPSRLSLDESLDGCASRRVGPNALDKSRYADAHLDHRG